MSKTSSRTIDGSIHQELSPVDKSAIAVTTQYDEGGSCVRSHTAYADGRMTQVISRYLLDGGSTYMVHNQILLDGALQAEAKSYFSRC